MRTKTLLCAAALAAGVATSMAQSNVYSLNVVGYVNTPLVGSGAGLFQMVANPLNATNNTIGALITAAPDFTTLYKWNGSGFDTANFFLGSWDNPGFTLNPGEGAIMQSTAPWTNTFVGEVLQGSLTNSTTASGFSIRASKVPQAGTLTALGLPGANFSDFDSVYQFNTVSQGYDIHNWFLGSWDSEPTLAVGESFWINSAAPVVWVRNFTVQ
jgi:hypothetical protein